MWASPHMIVLLLHGKWGKLLAMWGCRQPANENKGSHNGGAVVGVGAPQLRGSARGMRGAARDHGGMVALRLATVAAGSHGGCGRRSGAQGLLVWGRWWGRWIMGGTAASVVVAWVAAGVTLSTGQVITQPFNGLYVHTSM